MNPQLQQITSHEIKVTCASTYTKRIFNNDDCLYQGPSNILFLFLDTYSNNLCLWMKKIEKTQSFMLHPL